MDLGKPSKSKNFQDRTGRNPSNDWYLWTAKLLQDAGIIKTKEGFGERYPKQPKKKGDFGDMTAEDLARINGIEKKVVQPARVKDLPTLDDLLNEAEAKRTKTQVIMDSIGQAISPRKKIF